MLAGMTTKPSVPDVQAPNIAELLRALPASGLSTAAFVRAHGMAPWKLYNALRAQARRQSKGRKAAALIPVRVQDPAPKREASFELVLAGGHRVLVPEDFDAVALRRLLGTLSGC